MDLTGKTFNRLKVIEYGGAGKWHCICSCGTEKLIFGGDLRSGKTLSCGCYHRQIAGSQPKNKAGDRFGGLTLIKPFGTDGDNTIKWQCLCDCGAICIKTRQQLTRSTQKNCGSLVHKNRKTKIVPPTPTPYPEGASKIFAEYLPRLRPFAGFGWAEDIATEALLRAAYIIHWRETQGFPIECPGAYISKALYLVKIKHQKEQKQEKLGISCAKMGTFKAIGSEMTDKTFLSQTVAQAETQPEFCLPTRPKKFKRC